MGKIGSREVALLTIKTVFFNGAYSNIELSKNIEKYNLAGAERGLCARLVYGVIQNYCALDAYIDKFSKIKRYKMSPYVVCILRMSFYQILFLSKIPHSAVCNEAVNLTQKHVNRGAAGFVNGLLRNALRNLDDLALPKLKDEIEQLCLEYSLPKWMVKHFMVQYGREDALSIITSCNTEPHVYIKHNAYCATQEQLRQTLKEQGADIIEVPDLDGAYRLSYVGDSSRLIAFQQGMFFVEDVSSQLAVAALDVQPGDVVMDMCAAPGSKSFAMAQAMQKKGRIMAFDVHEHRLELVRESAKRMCIDFLDCSEQDATVFNENYIHIADKILVDAPCSGLGTIAKKPDIRLKRQGELAALPQVQAAILQNAAQYLKPGGSLVYSTCTLNPSENQSVVADFLEKHCDFKPVVIAHLDKFGEGILVSPEGFATLIPGKFMGDGFFVAKLLKKI